MTSNLLPDCEFRADTLFGISCPWLVPGFASRTGHVPPVQPGYRFHEPVTTAILAGFLHNRRVLVHGFHGTGKSSHIEQVAARLNWPCVRVNLDGQVSRMDLIGRDVVAVRDGAPVTEFQPGILTWALQNPVALVLDEYDAGRPDVMFLLQRVLEREGVLTLLDQARVITPHPAFRLFATANTIGLGDHTGLYQGSQILNQGQLDRWDITVPLNYVRAEDECAIVLSHFPGFDTAEGRATVARMVRIAGLTREAFIRGDLATVMSPRTVLSWAGNYLIFGNLAQSFCLSFAHRSDSSERGILAELYFRAMGEELGELGKW